MIRTLRQLMVLLILSASVTAIQPTADANATETYCSCQYFDPAIDDWLGYGTYTGFDQRRCQVGVANRIETSIGYDTVCWWYVY